MQLFEAIFQPLSLADFRQHFDQGKCLVVEGEPTKFDGLVSPDDIERRLNDGCNANQFVQVIKDGARAPKV
ncbi:hypothetical protein [Arenicella xantha]|uniref:Uncharacterized protein n=1 Tax=Arenicella xantha TaxID=644221 RepID=A0A395JIR9_9GAMM|nr:hypothetical protein [Arenicella xantha]RBP49925.1 hypothetical protein DFR28_103357 [Arenicella xantha]